MLDGAIRGVRYVIVYCGKSGRFEMARMSQKLSVSFPKPASIGKVIE